MVVFADKSRETELIEIWQRSFGDSEEYIRMFFEWNLSKSMVIVYEVDGRAVSVAYLLPVTYVVSGQESVSCWYLYAAATLPEFRGNGYFGVILKVVQEKIPEPVILVPGEASLIPYYEKQGLTLWLEERAWEVAYVAEKASVCYGHERMDVRDIPVKDIADMRELDAAEYAARRETALSGQPYIKWDEYFMNYICHENKVCSGKQKVITVSGREYIVMYRSEGGLLKVLEILPQTISVLNTNSGEQADFGERTSLEACVQILLKETGCKKANVCLNPPVMLNGKLNVRKNQGYFNLTMG